MSAVVWIILVVSVALWIITNLGKAIGDQKPKRDFGPPRDPNAPRPPSQHPTTDLDRFLQQAQERRREAEMRRRQEIEQRRAREREMEREAAVVRPETRERQYPPPERRTTPPPLPQTTPPPLPSAYAPPAMIQPTSYSKPVEQQWEQEPEPPTVIEIPQTHAQDLPQPHRAATVQARQAYIIRQKEAYSSGSVVASEVMRMLNDANSLRAAFILHEVLGRPACKRFGQRH